MVAKTQQESIRQRVLKAINAAGQATIHQIMGMVGRHIPITQAVRMARSQIAWELTAEKKGCKHRRRKTKASEYSLQRLADLGRRKILGNTLHGLHSAGLVVRVKRATYAPQKPKLYKDGANNAS